MLKLQYFGHLMWRTDSMKKKNPDAWKEWRQEEKGTAENEMVGWHHWLVGHKFEPAPRFGDGQGSLACYCPLGCTESGRTEWLNWTELKSYNGIRRLLLLDNSFSELSSYPLSCERHARYLLLYHEKIVGSHFILSEDSSRWSLSIIQQSCGGASFSKEKDMHHCLP